MPVTVDLARCDDNGECVKSCAFSAIEVHDGKAMVYENCTDCGACVLACPPKAIWSDLFSTTAASAIAGIDFSPASGIAGVVDRAARSSDATASWFTVDASDAGAAADAVAAHASTANLSLVVLPHSGPGPAMAARIAARLSANLMSGCSSLRLDEGGGVRASRPRFGGIVQTSSRAAAGLTVVTLLPRGAAHVTAIPIETPAIAKVPGGDAPPTPLALARRIVAIAPNLSVEADRAARACAQALGASIAEPASATGKPLSPDLYVAFGVDGSTEHNAAYRNSRVVVAVITGENAPIAQIADFLLVGDVEEHAKALLAAL